MGMGVFKWWMPRWSKFYGDVYLSTLNKLWGVVLCWLIIVVVSDKTRGGLFKSFGLLIKDNQGLTISGLRITAHILLKKKEKKRKKEE